MRHTWPATGLRRVSKEWALFADARHAADARGAASASAAATKTATARRHDRACLMAATLARPELFGCEEVRALRGARSAGRWRRSPSAAARKHGCRGDKVEPPMSGARTFVGREAE